MTFSDEANRFAGGESFFDATTTPGQKTEPFKSLAIYSHDVWPLAATAHVQRDLGRYAQR